MRIEGASEDCINYSGWRMRVVKVSVRCCSWAALLIALFISGSAQAEVQLPPFQQNIDLSSVHRLYKSAQYRVDVKPVGTSDDEFQQAFVFETRNDWVLRDYFNAAPQRRGDVIRSASETGYGKADLHTASFTTMSFAHEAVEIRVTLLDNARRIEQVQIRPTRFGLSGRISADRRSVTFTLDNPRKVSVEINGRLDPLFVFSDAPEVPDTKATYYFGPGVHRISGDGTLVLKSNQRVYIAAGAIVEGRFRLEPGSSHVSIRGRGLLSGGEWPDLQVNPAWQAKHAAIYSEGTDHFLLEGITFVQSTTWQVAIEDFFPDGSATHDNIYSDINTVSWNGCTDGIWITGNNNRVSNVFLFANDDAFVTKGGHGTHVSDAVVWGGTWGRLFLFFNTFPTTPPVENLDVENVDVIGKEGAVSMVLFQNWGRADHKPIKPTHNVTFRNIVFEERRRPGNTNDTPANAARLIELNTADVPGAVSGLKFENIVLDKLLPNEGEMLGTATSPITDVVFQNVQAGGKTLRDKADLPIKVNAYASYKVVGTESSQ